jgi:hypothetical protein
MIVPVMGPDEKRLPPLARLRHANSEPDPRRQTVMGQSVAESAGPGLLHRSFKVR